MTKRFIVKNVLRKPISKRHILNQEIREESKTIKEEIKNMDTKEKVEMVNSILDKQEINNVVKKNVKKIKNDKGLIERTDITKTIITEDNKELLHD